MQVPRFCWIVFFGIGIYAISIAQADPQLAASPTAVSQGVSADYVLGAEDVFSVTVLRHEEFSGEYVVPESGLVQLKATGELNVVGMSLSDLQKRILNKLRDRLRNPEVTVSLKLARPKRIYVLGDVRTPGIFEFKPEWGVAESLSAAGGLAPGIQIKDCKIVLERTQENTVYRTEKSLDEVLNGAQDGAARNEMRPRPGDVLRIESIQTIPVYVGGKVKVPGVYQLRADSTGVLEAIAFAQGAVEGAALSDVKIMHPDGTEEIVDLSMVLAKDSARSTTGTPKAPSTPLPRLKAGDIVLVPESLDRFAVLGYVTKPGFYNLPNGRRFTLAEALASAEGADKRGRISRIGLVRVENGKEVRRVYDLGKYFKGGDDKQNPEILAGDVLFVPETNRVDLTTVLSGISSTALFFNATRR